VTDTTASNLLAVVYLEPGLGYRGGMQIQTVDIKKLRGVSDKAVGLWKEAAGVLLNNDRLQQSGEAQQEKATETLKALRDEAKADAKEAKAEAIGKANPGSGGSGVFAEGKGKLKQAVGNVTGDNDMVKEGDADEERGSAQRSATKDRVAAKAHEAKAKASEQAENAS
jgi:uncharacterized protein YjbJ (UPF0337 family)